MSAISLIYNIDGAPVERRRLLRLMDEAATRGPDGRNHRVDGSLGVGFGAFHTTPESVHETQPLRAGDFTVVLDGRLDNRAELVETLRARGVPRGDQTDIELLHGAYRVWGEGCVPHLMGDFAFAVFDHARRALFCVRDYLGLRPLYYVYDGRSIVVGSTVRQMVHAPSIGPRARLNEAMAGEFLAGRITSLTDTLFEGIQRVKPGHGIVVTPGGLREVRHWGPDLGPELRYSADADYTEHLRELLREAVRCRLRSLRPVGVELSGGVDSSTVAATVVELVRDGVVPERGFAAVSRVFPGRVCDESPYIHDVVSRLGIPSHRFADDVAPEPGWAQRQVRHYRDIPDYPNGLGFGLRERARSLGFGVLLGGGGGDEAFTGSRYHLADLLRAGRIGQLRSRLRADLRQTSVPLADKPFLRYAVWPLVPESARNAFRALRGRAQLPPWIRPDFARRTGLCQRTAIEPFSRSLGSFAHQEMFRFLTCGWSSNGYDVCERFEAESGIEVRSPLLDRRVVEFGFRIPEEQRWRTQTKFVLRAVTRGILPDAVRLRDTKAHFSHLFVDALEQAGGEALFRDCRAAALGLVDSDRLIQAYRQMLALYRANDDAYATLTWPLWMTYGIGLFLTSERF